MQRIYSEYEEKKYFQDGIRRKHSKQENLGQLRQIWEEYIQNTNRKVIFRVEEGQNTT
jgi:hypothetical protein